MKLPPHPFTDGQGDDGWFDGLDADLDNLEASSRDHASGSSAERREFYWSLVTEQFDEEADSFWSDLSESQQVHVKGIFDRLWKNRYGE